MRPFAHLHCHTQYSLLDGAARINSLLDRAAELEMPAVAITDHGNLFGVPEFQRAAEKRGIRPLIGCEFYVTPASRLNRDDRTRYHQVLLARTEEGYRNLIKLSSLSYTEGYYYKPRIDHDLLRQYSGGLAATTCCLQGEVLQTILKRSEAEARKVFETYLEIFGAHYYIELQDHGIEEQRRCNEVLVRWAKEYNVRVVATNDVHYVHQEDAAAQDVLLCLQTGRDLSDPNRMRFENDQFFLKGADQMAAALSDLDTQVVDQALDNTLLVAESCTLDLPRGRLLMPHYPLPTAFGGDIDAYLRHLTYERASTRYPELGPAVTERLDHELGIIREMGYAGYFLIVQDFTTAARELGVSVGPGRGSAAGSAVAYCLGITNVDPLAYDLLFERFLNPERVSMPDIDIDFDDRGRGKVIDYVVQKYGRQNVCQIITFGTMGARSGIRDVARVLGIQLSEADRIAKMIPEGVGVGLDDALRDVPEFRALTKSQDGRIRKLIHYAKVLEGSARHTGVHAAGVIIAPGDVSEYVPVSIARSKSGGDDVVTTQYDGKWVEDFGLLKMDFLGLKTLTILNDAVDLILANRGVRIDLDAIPLDDADTFALFSRADTVAVFQFESEGMREWLRKLQPSSIDDLIAMNALYRPGPMDLIPNYVNRKHGVESVDFPHPMLEPILRPTYGIPVYQEQVMQMAREMGGYTLGGADLLRRAMGKKKQSEMDKHRTVFVAGALERDVPEKVANEVFDMMAKFAGYGFNKSHSAAYSIVAYQTAYLKTHYPAEFMAAAMTSEMADTRKLAVVLDDAQRSGITMLPPCINRSGARFTVDEGRIRFGLGAVKGVGRAAIEAIVHARAEHGPFHSLFEFVRCQDLRTVNKKTVDALARVGAFDDTEGHRAQLAVAVEAAFLYGQKSQADEAAGQSSLFGDGAGAVMSLEPDLPAVEPWPRARVLKEERELLGVYVSGHPLEAFRPEAEAFSTAELSQVDLFENSGDGAPRYGEARPTHSFFGIVTEVQRRSTKAGKPIAFAALEDYSGQAEIVCFSSVLERVNQYLEVDEIIMVRGHPEVRGGSLKIIVQEIWPMWKVREQLVKSIVLRLSDERIPADRMAELAGLCAANRGNCKLYFDIALPDSPEPQRVHARKFVVEPSQELMQGISRLFGRANIAVLGESS